ncbi:TetR/AcrR family transcriptional regulator C-terminal domain-containing protein [Paraburkholderia sp. CI3]|uniref:TetR/AcrR family transcriptional regulator C-terminal domain-containing protein n=1 Tax=Paraburkholderia sp. CI3 TaxID=2991060 RepID=UPI003D1E00B2
MIMTPSWPTSDAATCGPSQEASADDAGLPSSDKVCLLASTGDRPAQGLQAYQQRVSQEKRRPTLEVAIEAFLANGYDTAPEVESGTRETALAYNELVSDANMIAAMRLVIAQVRSFPDMGLRFQRAKDLFSDVTDAWLTKRVEEGRLESGNVQLARAEFIGMLGETLYFPRLMQIDYAIPNDDVETSAARSPRSCCAIARAE